MGPIQRLLMAGVVIVNVGCVIWCSSTGPNQDSPLPQSNSLRLHTISTSLSSPVFMTAPANDTTRLFMVDQEGLIRIFDLTSNSLLVTPFLNVSGIISKGGGEQGRGSEKKSMSRLRQPWDGGSISAGG